MTTTGSPSASSRWPEELSAPATVAHTFTLPRGVEGETVTVNRKTWLVPAATVAVGGEAVTVKFAADEENARAASTPVAVALPVFRTSRLTVKVLPGATKADDTVSAEAVKAAPPVPVTT